MYGGEVSSKKKLIIFGLEDFAQIAYQYFTYDSEYEVVAFCVHEKYINKTTLEGLPVVPFEKIEELYSAQDHYFYAAITYGRLNEIRANVCAQIKEKGYKLASYVSSKAFVWRNVKLGEHVFIFEGNVVQPFVEIGNNVVLWSGNHIGHHSKIGDNCFISSHVVVSGWCNVGDNCFIGVNTTLANNIKIGKECWVELGSIISRNVEDLSLVKSVKSEAQPLNKELLFKVLAKASKNRQS
jgi:sugar O-acyltransferase (sialic acid O-acetyltransferase NeuD family)